MIEATPARVAPQPPRASPKVRTLALLAAVALLASGCGGGGGSQKLSVDVNAHGRVVLGALAGATVEVYRVGQYGQPVATATTSSGATLPEIGEFSFALPAVSADDMFLLVARGGAAHDKDENGVLDGPTANQGKVHALASAAQLDGHTVHLSAITEVIYQRVRYFLEALYDDAFLAQACDAWTSFVLRSNVAGGPALGLEDALAFDPLQHASAPYRRYARYSSFVDTILRGAPATDEAFDLSREELSFKDLEGQTLGVALVGAIAYVCRGPGGLELWDASRGTDPTLLGRYDTPGFAVSVQVVGTLAYVADDTGGLQILDVSNPATPTLVRAVATTGPVSDLHVVGNRAYLSNPSAAPRLHIVDVATPATAALLSEVPTAAAASRVRVEGSFAYLCEAGQIEVLDVGNPLAPVAVGVVPAPGVSHLDLGPGHLYVATWTQLDVLSLAVPSAPQVIASLPLEGFGSGGLRVRGTQALLARSFDGLCLVDIADPAQPSVIGRIATSGGAMSLDADGGLVAISEANGGLCLVAAGTPLPSAVVASVVPPGTASAVDSTGNRTYLTTINPNRLVVLDTTNPLAPTVLGSVALATGFAEDLVVRDGYAFVAETGGLGVYDVSNPFAPSFVDGDATRTELQGLSLGTDVAYAACGSHVAVYDIATPSQTTLLTSRQVAGSALGLAYDGNALVVASGWQGVLTFDATTPTAPTQEGSIAAPAALDVVLKSSFAFVTGFSDSGIGDRLLVIDCAVLDTPLLSRSVLLPGAVDRVVRAGDRLYASARLTGVNVVDVTVPQASFHQGTIPVPASIEDLDAEGGFLYVADGYPTGALLVLRAAQVSVP